MLAQYEEDYSATWLYTRALVTFRRHGETPESKAALREAIKQNRYVPAYLLGKKRLPQTLPGLIGFGDEREAISYAAEFLEGWRQTPGALDWLARMR